MLKKTLPKVFLTGESGSGKTTLLYLLKLNEIVTTIPTVGFNVECINLWNREYEFWDFTFNLLKLYLQPNMIGLAGIVHLCRDASETNKKSICTVVESLKQNNLTIPILILLNEDEVFPATFEEEMRKLLQYEGKLNFRKFNLFNMINPLTFLEKSFPEMLFSLILFFFFLL